LTSTTHTGKADLRRRLVVITTLVAGAALLGSSLSVPPGDTLFYPLTFAVAAVWSVGAALSGPLPLGQLGRRFAAPVLLGLGAAAVFVLGTLVIRDIAPLRDEANAVLAHARHGPLLLVVAVALLNGAAEELFFRGALYAAVGPHAVAISTVAYGMVTVATGNWLLVLTAFALGAALALVRRRSGGVLAPMLMHVAWSAVLVLALPPLIG
jgi:membrane protease YdiL (CAAX protease family)